MEEINKNLSNNLIAKSNDFILNAKYDMSILEIRLVSILLTKINKEHDNFFTISFSLQDFKKNMSMETKSRKEITKLLKGLRSRTFVIEEENQDVVLGFIDHSVITNNSVEIRFNEHMKKYFLQLKQNFTVFELNEIHTFKSIYSFRIYEIIKLKYKQFKTYNNVNNLLYTTSIEDLKILLGVENKYKRYDNFKTRVLQVAQDELRVKSNIHLHFKEVKLGRKVVGLELYPQETIGGYENEDFNSWLKRLKETCVNELIYIVSDTQHVSVSGEGYLYNMKKPLNHVSTKVAKQYYEYLYNNKDKLEPKAKELMGVRNKDNLPSI